MGRGCYILLLEARDASTAGDGMEDVLAQRVPDRHKIIASRVSESNHSRSAYAVLFQCHALAERPGRQVQWLFRIARIAETVYSNLSAHSQRMIPDLLCSRVEKALVIANAGSN